MTDQVKIHFSLIQDEDGYPPVASESMWAHRVGRLYRIDNIPFFARAATVGDLVHALPDEEGHLWFDNVADRSGHSLIRLCMFESGCKESVMQRLKELGCGTEGMQSMNIIAVDIPPDADLADVQRFLQQEAGSGRIDYEEPLLRHPE